MFKTLASIALLIGTTTSAMAFDKAQYKTIINEKRMHNYH
jgi:hypothetical protein